MEYCLPQCESARGLTFGAIGPRQLRSPAWHRAARKGRSRARKRVRQAKLFGRKPRVVDCKRLLHHHSASKALFESLFPRRLPLEPAPAMGREQWGARSDAWSSQPGQSWQLWSGARPQKSGGAYPWKKGSGKADADKNVKFPAFDARTPQGDSTAPPQRERAPRQVEDAEGMDDLLVPGVQKALNGARKAEARVARILRDRKKTEQQWQEYVRDSRAAYVKEHARYLKAVEIYDRDLVEATEQQTLRIAY